MRSSFSQKEGVGGVHSHRATTKKGQPAAHQSKLLSAKVSPLVRLSPRRAFVSFASSVSLRCAALWGRWN